MDTSMLRFSVGDRVQCQVYSETQAEEDSTADGWMPGTIVAVGYHEASWEGGSIVPYQVELDNAELIFIPEDSDNFCRIIELAWWEPVFWNHLTKPDPHKNMFDWPGLYLVIKNTFVSSACDRSQAQEVAGLQPPAFIEVVEVQSSGDRVRARITEPAGWVSLRSTDNEKVFAVPENSAHARLFRKFNPDLFSADGGGSDDVFSNFPKIPSALRDGSCKLSVEDLRRRGVNVDMNVPNQHGVTAVVAAVYWHWVEGIEALIEMKVDVNKSDAEGRQPLHLALTLGNEAVVDALLTAGASEFCCPCLAKDER
eukprot:gnl/MRDRNA2_/MRDRNA2_93006_c0_seq1.p1 gnl/MRDRNA2_/MRDRNA2_93006_c0~~gnl/MRDRNA2_/MRDRNA2_93006_c0_seq1.p1  ORF type:complete len:311 (+),score=68.26 gnl/MRDRNA2_/MRDRNA2_93006_c0_seq1:97-1029(+)